MKKLTEVVVALIEMMEAEEQDEFLATMATGKRPTKPQRPMTDAERWWRDKLNPRTEWATSIAGDDLVDDFIQGTGWKGTRHGACTSMGKLLKKLCPNIRRHDGKFLMPPYKDAKRDFLDVFPGRPPAASEPVDPQDDSVQTLLVDGKMVKVLRSRLT